MGVAMHQVNPQWSFGNTVSDAIKTQRNLQLKKDELDSHNRYRNNQLDLEQQRVDQNKTLLDMIKLPIAERQQHEWKLHDTYNKISSDKAIANENTANLKQFAQDEHDSLKWKAPWFLKLSPVVNAIVKAQNVHADWKFDPAGNIKEPEFLPGEIRRRYGEDVNLTDPRINEVYNRNIDSTYDADDLKRKGGIK